MSLKLFINNLSFRTKMLYSYLVISLVSFLVFAFASGGIVTKQLRRSATMQSEQTITQVENSISVYLQTMEHLVDYVSELTLEGDANLPLLFEKLRQTHPEIAGILLARTDDSYLSNGLRRVSRDPFSNESWYIRAKQAEGSLVLLRSNAGRNITTEDVFSVGDVFSIAKSIVDPLTNTFQGVVLFDVHHDIIRNSSRNASIGEKGFVFILDDQDEMVYAPINPVVYRVNPRWLAGENTSISVDIEGERYYLQSRKSPTTGWRVVGVFPSSEVLHDMTTTMYVMALSLLGSLVSIALLSYLLSRSITKPLSKLQRLMGQAEAGDLSVRFNSKYTDEVGSLGQSFNHMLLQIEQLVQQVYIEQQNKRNAELRILQEQIKPHFLYNTLDTISWLSRENGAEDVVLLVDALTNMFRVGLSKGKETITIREEICHVSSYLYIQQIRYSTKLAYEIEVPEVLENYLVPKLILQPLVENAIYHGIKQKREKGRITVKVSLGEEALSLQVRDTGPGIEASKLKLLQAQLQGAPRTEESGFGLFYVNEQVKLSCGQAYGVVLDSEEGAWTTATVYVPAMKKEEVSGGQNTSITS
ncbi:MAG: cache domain-containing sensor histidine kinase [Sphaerochaetaceae bacterium]